MAPTQDLHYVWHEGLSATLFPTSDVNLEVQLFQVQSLSTSNPAIGRTPPQSVFSKQLKKKKDQTVLSKSQYRLSSSAAPHRACNRQPPAQASESSQQSMTVLGNAARCLCVD